MNEVSLSRQLARWSLQLRYDDLPREVVECAKRFLYDSMGCAFGGYGTEDVRIMLGFSLLYARLLELARHDLGIQHVHLATVCADIQGVSHKAENSTGSEGKLQMKNEPHGSCQADN